MAYDISELQAVDFALGSFISGTFSGMATDQGPRQWQEFLSRPVSRQIYRSDQQTPKEFLGMVAKYRRTETPSPDGDAIVMPQMPVVYYFRKPNISNGDHRFNQKEKKALPASPVAIERNGYSVMFLPTMLSYEIFFVAWDKPTLDRMQLAWYGYLTRAHDFEVGYDVNGEMLPPVNCRIWDWRDFLMEDHSIHEEASQRLWAVGTTFDVYTQIVYGDQVSVSEGFTAMLVRCGYCGDDPSGCGV